MPESEGDFKKFLESIPQEVTAPLEKEDGGDLISESQDLITTIEVIKGDDAAKEAQFALLPKINKMIADLRDAQAKGDSETVRNSIVKLVAERDRIDQMKN